MKIVKMLIVLGSAMVIGPYCNSIDETDYKGNFKEHKYDFFESFQHTTDKEFYHKLPYDLKFTGINPSPFDSIGKKDYSWLRNPDNLMIAFNTIKSIGLDRFVTREQYNKKNNDWCCDTQWENKSLNEIVKEFIHSDTSLTDNDYYSKFWNRRRKEGNLGSTYLIFRKIDNFYNGIKKENQIQPIDSTLKSLLNYDIELMNSDSIAYPKTILKYFEYLKSINLDYSAYKLIFHNSRLDFSKKIKDSLLVTIKHDTLSKEDWEKMNDNSNGWIKWEDYPDPNRYYGP